MLNLGNLIDTRNRNIAGGAFSLIAGIILLSLLLGSRATAFVSEVGPFVVIGSLINVVICWRRAFKADSALLQRSTPIEDRFDELERLKRRDMVTPEEYAAKRQEILKDL
jgi:hypothetical protein